MSFQVTTAIKKLLRLGKRIRVVPGGTWAGKTYVILAIEIDYLIRNVSDTTVVAETIPAIKKGALKQFKEIMEETGRWLPDRYNATDRIYTFTNGSKIEFTAFDSEDKAKQSGKRKRLFVNEVNTMSKLIVDALMIRTEEVVWLDYNPSAPFWVNREFENSDSVDWCVLTYRDNEALPKTILDELLKRREKAKTSTFWSNWCDVYLDGKVGQLDGVVLTDWKLIDVVPEEARLLCYGMDFGYTNDPSTMVAVYKYNDSYIADEVFYKKGLLNRDISNIINRHDIKDIIYADSAEPKSIAELNTYGHTVLPCKKGRDSIMHGVTLINQNKVYITKNSTNLIHELRNYIWMTDKEGNKINKPIDAFNHCIDAFRYGLSMQLENPHVGEYHVW